MKQDDKIVKSRLAFCDLKRKELAEVLESFFSFSKSILHPATGVSFDNYVNPEEK